MPAHAFLIDDVLVVAGKLVNGATIRRMTRDELGSYFTYYAIETEDHSLIMIDELPIHILQLTQGIESTKCVP